MISTAPQLRIRTNGDVSPFTVPEHIIDLCQGMSQDLLDYFYIPVEALLIPIRDIVLCRARPEGLERAARRMKEAALGLRQKRAPVRVRQCGTSFLILDGNSTTVVLAAIRVDAVPVLISADAEDAPAMKP